MAVYTKITEHQVSEFLLSYDLGTLTALEGIKAGVSNSNYFLETTKGRYILTLYESRTHEKDLPYFLELMEHLALKNIPCPLPIRGLDGGAKRTLGKNPAAIISFLEGKARSRVTPQECAEVGEALALMHLAGLDFKRTRQNDLSLPGWRTLLNSCSKHTDNFIPGITKYLNTELEFLELHWPQDLPKSVIHADLFPDNVFFNGDKLCGIIDFYFACNDFAAYDIAICLNAWCFENNNMSFNITKSRSILENYQRQRVLTKDEMRAIPILSRGACMRFILTRLIDAMNQVDGALVKPKDPLDYVARLKFHQQINDATTYGLTV